MSDVDNAIKINGTVGDGSIDELAQRIGRDLDAAHRIAVAGMDVTVVGLPYGAPAIDSFTDDVRRVVAEHAASLQAYYGRPVVQLSRDEIALWLGLRAEFEKAQSASVGAADAADLPDDPVQRDAVNAIEAAARSGFKIASWRETTDHGGHPPPSVNAESAHPLWTSRKKIEIVLLK